MSAAIHTRDGFTRISGVIENCFVLARLRCEARVDDLGTWVPAWIAELLPVLWDHESCAGRAVVALPTERNTERLAWFLARCQRDFALRDAALSARRLDPAGGLLIALVERTEARRRRG